MPNRQTLTRAEREASGWIVRIKAHDASEADRRDFQAWLDADPDHPKAYAKLERTWGRVQSLQHLKGRTAANDTAPTARPHWTRPAIALAACALLAAGLGVWFTRAPSPFAPSEHYATAPAEVRTITLGDGSTITLSGAGEVSIAISDSERRVELTSGYALFDVTHDPAKPFVVHTPRGDIRVLGTEFVVRIGADEVRTTVLRGSVSGAAERTGLLSGLGPAQSVTAHANEEIVLRDERAELIPIAAEAIPRRLAWRDNMLSFDGETLNEAIAQVSRQTGWQFELADPALGELRVGGYVHADPEAFIALMSSSLNLEAQREGDRRVVLSRRS
ncbi:MAG: FecR domain-containing protein [Terricaulis sp.]